MIVSITDTWLADVPPASTHARSCALKTGADCCVCALQDQYWDKSTKGFGVKIGRTGRKTFVARWRSDGTQHMVAVGVFGDIDSDGNPITTERARIKAKKLIAGEIETKPAPNTKSIPRKITEQDIADWYGINQYSAKQWFSELRTGGVIKTIGRTHVARRQDVDDWSDERAIRLLESNHKATSGRHRNEIRATRTQPIGSPVRFRVVGVYPNGAEQELTAVAVLSGSDDPYSTPAVEFVTADEEFCVFVARRPRESTQQNEESKVTYQSIDGAPF